MPHDRSSSPSPRRIAALLALGLGSGMIGCGGPVGASGSGGAGGGTATCDSPAPAGATPPFVDATLAWGLDFRHHAADGMCGVLDTVGGPGVCSFDYDGDGDVDLYFADRAPHPNRLYRNDGGRFTDVTAESGAGLTDDTHACLAFDFDGDGDLDLFAGGSGPDRLLRNDGGTFTDVTEAMGFVEEGFSTTATAGDIDGDGDLDLFVGHLVAPDSCPEPYCWPSPGLCEAQKNQLFVNDGGVFHEASAERGITEVEPTLASLFFDADGDGDLDLFVGNDIGAKFPDRLYRNDGKGMFEEAGEALGLSFPGTSTMGVDVGDADGDGAEDVVISDYSQSPIRLALCKHSGQPCEVFGIDEGSVESVKWSIALEDFDQDGDLDVFTVAGNTAVPEGYQGDRHQLHWNDGTGVFTVYEPKAGEALASRQIGRGAAFADIDGDLDLDIIIANADRPAQLLLNQGTSGHGLLVHLPTTSAGARVTVSAKGISRTEHALIGGSYAGSSDPRVHFGLGETCAVDVTVEWPGGQKKTFGDVKTGQVLIVD